MTTATFDPVAQREEALAKGNRVRLFRAQLKRDIRAGKVSWCDIVRNPPQDALSMLLVDVLMAAPKVGQQGADAALSRAAVGPRKRLNQLTPREVSAICDGQRLKRGAGDMTRELREENARLRAENDRLARDIEAITQQPWHMELARLRRELKQLRQENRDLGRMVAA